MNRSGKQGGASAPPFVLVLVLFGVCLGCTSSASPPSDKLTVTIAQTSAVNPLLMSTQTAVPVDFRLDITNPFDHPVTLTTVEIETVGSSGGYAMKRVRHSFETEIPAETSKSIALRVWVQPLQMDDRGQVSNPVMLRGTARFNSNGNVIQSAFAGRVQ